MIVCTQIARYLKIRVFTIKSSATSQSSKLLEKSVNSSNGKERFKPYNLRTDKR